MEEVSPDKIDTATKQDVLSVSPIEVVNSPGNNEELIDQKVSTEVKVMTDRPINGEDDVNSFNDDDSMASLDADQSQPSVKAAVEINMEALALGAVISEAAKQDQEEIIQFVKEETPKDAI